MSDLQILNIDLKMEELPFTNEFHDFANNYENNYGPLMKMDVKSMRTKHGKNMFKIEIKNDNGSDFSIVAEQNDVTGEMMFLPLTLSNMEHGFYSVSVDVSEAKTVSDPSKFWNSFMQSLCVSHQGTYVSLYDSDVTLIKDGKPRNKASLAIVDSDGEVHCCINAKKISGGQDDVNFSVNVPISEWMADHQDVAAAIGKMSIIEKMDYIGKYLVAARLNDEIDSDEFVDIFRQAGIIGFSDTSILNIYKLLM